MAILQTAALLLGYAAIKRAGNEIRTRDPHLGKVVLYQLSYSRNLRPQRESNPCLHLERVMS